MKEKSDGVVFSLQGIWVINIYQVNENFRNKVEGIFKLKIQA